MKQLTIIFCLCISSLFLKAQVTGPTVDYANPKEYIIGDITVSGTQFLDKDILILLSGLKRGDRIMIPGSEISKCVQTLWKQGLFADVAVNITSMSGDTVYLDYAVAE